MFDIVFPARQFGDKSENTLHVLLSTGSQYNPSQGSTE